MSWPGYPYGFPPGPPYPPYVGGWPPPPPPPPPPDGLPPWMGGPGWMPQPPPPPPPPPQQYPPPPPHYPPLPPQYPPPPPQYVPYPPTLYGYPQPFYGYAPPFYGYSSPFYGYPSPFYGYPPPFWAGSWGPYPPPPPPPPMFQFGGSWAGLGGWPWTIGPRNPRRPLQHNPFWPYPLPGLPAGHRVWDWLENIDGGPWEDVSLVSEHMRTSFKSKIVHYFRVVLEGYNHEYYDPTVFGLYPPAAGPRAPTVVTLSSTASPTASPSRSDSMISEVSDSVIAAWLAEPDPNSQLRSPCPKQNPDNNPEHNPDENLDDSPDNNPEHKPDDNLDDSPDENPDYNLDDVFDDLLNDSSSEESIEIGRGYIAPDNMDFQSFSDPPSPIRGNFIPLSDGFNSPSPASQPSIHKGQQLSPINELITETDEEKFDELIERGKMQYQRARDASQQGNSTPPRRAADRDDPTSSRRSRSRSPEKYTKSASPSRRSRSSSPVKSSTRRRHGAGQPRVSFTFHDSEDDDDVGATFNTSATSKNSQDYVVSPISPASPTPSLSRRRLMPDLEPIDVSVTRQEARAEALRKGHIPVAMHVPEKDAREIQPRTEPAPKAKAKATVDRNYSSSDYSQEGDREFPRKSARVDPLHVNGRPPSNRMDARQSIFDTYLDWKEGMNKRASGVYPNDEEESVFEPDYHAQKKAMDMALRKKAPQVSKAQQAGYNGDHYSPLDVMFPFENQVTTSTRKASSKTMIGSKGWLEDTSTSPQRPAPPKNNGFFENLRKKAKELINMGSEQLAAPRHPNKSKQDVRERQLVISLDPREQSLLYCELEFILASALNSYITCQFNAGRLVTDKLKRVSDGWQQRGRPKVVGFRYDIETQLDLVRLHVPEFRFYSRQVNEAAIYGMIDMMRVNARAMRIRTYCQPDTVISKQILDARNLLNLIGSGEDEHVALASVTQFYRDALAREKVFHYDAAEHVSDSTRLRNADRHWRQNRDDSGFASTPQSGSRYADHSGHVRRSRENSSVAPTTPHKSPYKSSRGRTRTPDTPFSGGGLLDMMA